MEMSSQLSLQSKVISTLIKPYIKNMINETILNKKVCFVIAFGARAPPSCTVSLRVMSRGWLAPMTSIVIQAFI